MSVVIADLELRMMDCGFEDRRKYCDLRFEISNSKFEIPNLKFQI
jgi:hypothetical protein